MPSERPSFQSIPRLFLKYYGAPALLSLVLAGLFLAYSWSAQFDELCRKEQIVLAPGSREIERVITRRTSELRTLIRLTSLTSYLDHPTPANRLRAAEDLVTFAKSSRIYSQISYLDTAGQENILINLTPLGAYALPDSELQSRADRYYFKEVIKMYGGQIYLSSFDLKTSKGKVETPYTPVLRLASPLFDSKGTPKGVLLLYYLGDDLLQRLDTSSFHSNAHQYLLNSNGYWLKGPDSSLTWGFMFNRPDLSMAHRHPMAWQRIREGEIGQFRDKDGLWTFSTATPLNIAISNTALGSSAWKLVSHIPAPVLENAFWALARPLILITVLVLLLVAGVAWQLARNKHWRQLREYERWLDHKRLQSLAELFNDGNVTEQGIFDHALNIVVELTASKIGYIYYYNEENNLFILHAWSNEVMDRCRIAQPQTMYELEKTGIWGEAVRQRKPIVANDFEALNPLKKGYPEGHVALKRYLTIPVFDKDRIVAVVGVANKLTPYDQVDIQQLQHYMQGVWQITLRRQMEQEQVRLLTVLEESLNEIYLFSTDTLRFTYVNRSALQNLGYTLEEAVKLTAFSIKPLIDEALFRSMVQQLLTGTRSKLEFQTIHQRKDGSSYSVEVHLQLIQTGTQASFLAIIFDISERLALEEHLRHTQKLESVGQLSSGIAHDFNNILQIISGNTQMLQLQSRATLGTAPAQLTDIMTAVERGTTLTASMLAFSRRQTMLRRSLDLNGLVQESELLASRLLTTQHYLQVSLYDCPLQVSADPTLLQQVLFNLITNARDAMPDGGCITIVTGNSEFQQDAVKLHGCREAGIYALLSVSDTGPGISDDIRQRIYEPFFTTKEVGKGTGLGLAMIYGTIKQHNGFIMLDTRPGDGTTFTVCLPVLADDATAQTIT
jgi:PAS domain S-box-containing protein